MARIASPSDARHRPSPECRACQCRGAQPWPRCNWAPQSAGRLRALQRQPAAGLHGRMRARTYRHLLANRLDQRWLAIVRHALRAYLGLELAPFPSTCHKLKPHTHHAVWVPALRSVRTKWRVSGIAFSALFRYPRARARGRKWTFGFFAVQPAYLRWPTMKRARRYLPSEDRGSKSRLPS